MRLDGTTPRAGFLTLGLLLAPLFFTHKAQADVISATDRGNYSVLGTHAPGSTNYFAGRFLLMEHRNFFVFDLSGITDPIASARLNLFNPSGRILNGYTSPDATETFVLYDVTTPAAILTSGTGGFAAFGDLGNGTVLGNVIMSAADNGQFVSVEFNQDGLNALNASAGGTFVVGGRLQTLSGGLNNEYVFGWTGTQPMSSTTLEYETVETPEPATLAMVGLGVLAAGAVGAGRRIRRIHA